MGGWEQKPPPLLAWPLPSCWAFREGSALPAPSTLSQAPALQSSSSFKIPSSRKLSRTDQGNGSQPPAPACIVSATQAGYLLKYLMVLPSSGRARTEASSPFSSLTPCLLSLYFLCLLLLLSILASSLPPPLHPPPLPLILLLCVSSPVNSPCLAGGNTRLVTGSKGY